MILKNLDISEEVYIKHSENEIILVRKQKWQIAFVIGAVTLLTEANLINNLSFQTTIIALLCFLPITLYLLYNKRLVIEKESRLVHEQSYINDFLLTSSLLTRIEDQEVCYVNKMDDGEEQFYSLLVKRNRDCYLFSFKKLKTYYLLHSELKTNLNINLVFNRSIDDMDSEWTNYTDQTFLR